MFGELPNRLTPAQRQVLATTRPHEELYDLRADPYEIQNLADDPRYAADLERLRNALVQWQQTYGDLGMIPEMELIERWRPGGVWPLTEPPALQIADGRIVATCATVGAAIGWTTDPPAKVRKSTLRPAISAFAVWCAPPDPAQIGSLMGCIVATYKRNQNNDRRSTQSTLPPHIHDRLPSRASAIHSADTPSLGVQM